MLSERSTKQNCNRPVWCAHDRAHWQALCKTTGLIACVSQKSLYKRFMDIKGYSTLERLVGLVLHCMHLSLWSNLITCFPSF